MTIGLVGKYVGLHDAYLSVAEALNHAGYAINAKVNISWIDSEELNKDNTQKLIDKIGDTNYGYSTEACLLLKQNNSEIIKINNINEEFFYLQGGVDYTKLKGIKKFMLKMVAESVIKENKPEDKELIDIFLNGGNCVKEENLSEIVEYLTM